MTTPDDAVAPDVTRLRVWARVVLVPVGLIGAALSFASIYEAARPTYGPVLAAGFPFLVDFLILGVSLQYIAGARVGRARIGWRLTAHAGVAGTLLLNGLAARDLAHLPWHVVAPAVWSVLVEMSAREVVGEYRATRRAPADRIPARLWLTAPVESARTWLLMARSGGRSHAAARVDVGVLAAAGEALRLALPGRRPRRVRRIIRRQLRAGSLPPAHVLASLGWTDATSDLVTDPSAVLRATLTGVLAPALVPPAQPAPGPVPARPGRSVPLSVHSEPVRAEPMHGVQAGPVHSAPPIPAPVRAERLQADVMQSEPVPAAAVRAEAVEPSVPVPVKAEAVWPEPVQTPTAAVLPHQAVSAPASGVLTVPGEAGQSERTRAAVAVGAEPAPAGLLDAPRRPFNDPIFLAPVPAVPEPEQLPVVSTGDRPSDAVALLRAQPHLPADGLAEQLRALGWVLNDRTARQVHAQARHYLRGPLTAVR